MQSLPSAQPVIVRLLALALLASLASCALYDPGYQEGLAVAETNPPSDAIVGMWHRTNHSGAGTGVRSSILFSGNGTGLVDTVADDSWGNRAETTDEIGPFQWHYDGSGVWSLTNAKGRIDQCRLSGGRLLRFYNARKQTGGVGYFVYERVGR